MKSLNEGLIIVGSSVRAWLQSGRRAGFDVAAFDFFADWDTLDMLAPCRESFAGEAGAFGSSLRRIASFGDLLDPKHEQIINRCREALICGGFESHVDLVDSLSARIAVLGTDKGQLRRIRDRPGVFKFLRQNGFAIPETKLKLGASDDRSVWLRKECGSSGGQGVRAACAMDVGVVKADDYFQARVPGTSVSAVFLSYRAQWGDVKTLLFGVTHQIVGDPQLGASEFQYCGSIGPMEVSHEISDQIKAIGGCLACEFEILGLWGVDFMVSENVVMPVDVNPRLTASMELFEWTFFKVKPGIRSIVDLHVKACRGQLDVTEFANLKRAISFTNRLVEGKAILFHRGKQALGISPEKFTLIQRMFDSSFFDSAEPGFSVADIPNSGQSIEPGHPILTIRMRMKCHRMLARLHRQAAEIAGFLEDRRG